MINLSSAREDISNMECIIYIRVSSDDQIKNFSLGTQEDICRSHAERLGYKSENLVIFTEKGESAKTANRPELIEMLEYCRINKNKVSTVLVYKIDRMARETSDYLAIKKRLYELGIKLESASEPTGNTPTEKFIETILAAGAQLDNEVRGERAKNGLRKRFLEGYHPSKPPRGYTSVKNGDGRSVSVPNNEFEAFKSAWLLMGTGTKSLSEIRKILADQNISVGKQTLSEIFHNKFYCGYITSKKHPGEEIKTDKHTPMISEELFYRVQAILSGKAQRPLETNKIVTNEQFELKGVVKCWCGKPLIAANCKGGSGIYYPKYWCRVHPTPSISIENMNKQLMDLLAKIQPSQEAINLFTLILKKTYGKRLQSIKQQQSNAEKKLIELKQMMTLLVEGHLKGLYEDDIYKEQKLKLDDQILSANILKNDNLCEQYDIESITGFINALLTDLPKAYEVSTYGQRRILLSSTFPSGLTFSKGELSNENLASLYTYISSPSDLVGLTVLGLNDLFTSLKPLILAYPTYQSQFNHA